MVGVLEVFFGAYRPCIDFGQAFTFDARLSNEMDLVATFEDARISNSMIGKETGEDGKNTRSCLSLNSPNRNNGSFDHFNHVCNIVPKLNLRSVPYKSMYTRVIT